MNVDPGPLERQAGQPPASDAGFSPEDPERSLCERFARTRPEHLPTDIEALRARIASEPGGRTPQSPPHPRTNPAKGRVVVRTAAGLAALAGLALLFLSFRPTPTAAMTVLQEAQESLERTRSVSFEMSAFDAGTRLNPAPVRIRILAPGRVRIEEPGGNYSVTDLKSGKSLRVVPGAKRAQLIERTAAPGEAGLVDFYDFFRSLDRKKTGDLPSRTIGGVEAIGFEAVVGDPVGKGGAAVQTIRVWVHPRTKLPLRLEHEPKSVHSYGKVRVPTAVCENFVFDEALDPDLFSLEPPKGYKTVP